MKPEQATKHLQQVNYLVSSNKFEMDDDGFVTNLKEFIEKKLKDRSWAINTLRTYLNSLLKFSHYLTKMNRLGLPNYSNVNANNLELLRTFINEWTNSLNKKSNEESKNKAKEMSHDNNKVKPDDIQRYTESNRAQLATKILSSERDVILATLNSSTHNLLRNYLIMNLVFSNGHKTGCITNLTLAEIRDGKAHVKSGHHIIFVWDHKTRRTYGAADLVISPKIYHYIETYVDLCRPASESTAVFLNWGGAKMDSGSVTNALSAELRHAGINKQ